MHLIVKVLECFEYCVNDQQDNNTSIVGYTYVLLGQLICARARPDYFSTRIFNRCEIYRRFRNLQMLEDAQHKIS